METRTRAYIEYEKRLKILDQNAEFKKMLQKEVEEMTEHDWEVWRLYNEEVSRLWKNVEEDSYLELYDLFQKVTGYTLEYLEVGWRDFKISVDEWLGYDEEVYDLYFPDMVVHFMNFADEMEREI